MNIPDGYLTFNSFDEKLSKYIEWGFKTKKKNELKTLYYKGVYSETTEECDIIGYYNNDELLIELKSSKVQLVIHHDYLHQMQQKSFNRNAM